MAQMDVWQTATKANILNGMKAIKDDKKRRYTEKRIIRHKEGGKRSHQSKKDVADAHG